MAQEIKVGDRVQDDEGRFGIVEWVGYAHASVRIGQDLEAFRTGLLAHAPRFVVVDIDASPAIARVYDSWDAVVDRARKEMIEGAGDAGADDLNLAAWPDDEIVAEWIETYALTVAQVEES